MLSIGAEMNSLKKDGNKWAKHKTGNSKKDQNISLPEITQHLLHSMLVNLSIHLILDLKLLVPILTVHVLDWLQSQRLNSKQPNNFMFQLMVGDYGILGLIEIWFWLAKLSSRMDKNTHQNYGNLKNPFWKSPISPFI